MPSLLKSDRRVPFELTDGARLIGERISLARKRRQLTLRELASRAGISCDTVRSIENGSLQTSLGAYLAVLWAMGLESDLKTIASPGRDKEGQQWELSRLPKRVRHAKVNYDDYRF